jgi:hypothetical protein
MYWEEISKELQKLGTLMWEHRGYMRNDSWKVTFGVVNFGPRAVTIPSACCDLVDFGSTAPGALFALWDQITKRGSLQVRVGDGDQRRIVDFRFNGRWQYRETADSDWKFYKFDGEG